MTLTQYLSQLGALLFVYWLYRTLSRKRSFPLPPGPPCDPFIGHLRLFMHGVEEETYDIWRKQYGMPDFLIRLN